MRPVAIADVGPDVGHAARREQGVAGLQDEALRANFHQELPFHGVEPLILVVVQVARRAAGGVERVLDDQDAPALLRADLEADLTHAQPAPLAVAVGAGGEGGRGRLVREAESGFRSIALSIMTGWKPC
jgi:hypothetical protein